MKNTIANRGLIILFTFLLMWAGSCFVHAKYKPKNRYAESFKKAGLKLDSILNNLEGDTFLITSEIFLSSYFNAYVDGYTVRDTAIDKVIEDLDRHIKQNKRAIKSHNKVVK